MRKPLLFVIFALFAAGTLWYYFFGERGGEVIAEQVVAKGNLQNAVRVFGKAEPDKIFTLAFEIGGTVTSYPFEVGDRVTKGKTLAKLSSTSVSNQIRETQSRINIEQKKKDELTAPVQSSELTALEARLDQAEAAVNSFESNLDQVIEQTRVSLDTFFTTYVDEYFDDVDRLNVLEFDIPGSTFDTFDKRNLLGQREAILTASLDQKFDSNLGDSYANLFKLFDEYESFANLIEVVVNKDAKESVSESVESQMNQLRLEIQSKRSSLVSVNNQLTEARQAVSVAQQDIQVAQVGPSGASVKLQDSIIADKRVALTSLYNDLSKYSIKSPITGEVFQTFIEQYTAVAPNSPVISIVEEKPLVVRADVAESDIVYVGVGNVATITFDALPGEQFDAQVQFVESQIDTSRSVPTYETTLEFSEGQDLSSIRSGMTANIIVSSGSIEDVLFVPANFIVNDGVSQYVYKKTSESGYQKTTVTTGYRTNTSDVEITSGLNEGESIVIFKQ